MLENFKTGVNSKRKVFSLLVLATLVFQSSPCSAQGKSDFDAASLFRSNCAPCHGVTGVGDGPVASALKKRPPSLPTLSKRHGGVFPEDYVYRMIDGRAEVAAHGNRVMPVWGEYFGEQHQGAKTGQPETEMATKTKIEALINYLKSIQSN
jgi:mono/diheme cytochrome c family protein